MHGGTRVSNEGTLDRRATFLGVVLSALLLAGCAVPTPHWVKPGVTAAQLRADRDACLARSQTYLPTPTGETRPDYQALEHCMVTKGYTAARPK